jgi:hypothetical protein
MVFPNDHIPVDVLIDVLLLPIAGWADDVGLSEAAEDAGT